MTKGETNETIINTSVLPHPCGSTRQRRGAAEKLLRRIPRRRQVVSAQDHEGERLMSIKITFAVTSTADEQQELFDAYGELIDHCIEITNNSRATVDVEPLETSKIESARVGRAR